MLLSLSGRDSFSLIADRYRTTNQTPEQQNRHRVHPIKYASVIWFCSASLYIISGTDLPIFASQGCFTARHTFQACLIEWLPQYPGSNPKGYGHNYRGSYETCTKLFCGIIYNYVVSYYQSNMHCPFRKAIIAFSILNIFVIAMYMLYQYLPSGSFDL